MIVRYSSNMVERILFFILFLGGSNVFAQISSTNLIGEYLFINKDLDSAYLKLKADSLFTYTGNGIIMMG